MSSEGATSSSRPIANIPDPVGTRYSRRVRGISDGVIYDASVLELVESSRRRSTKPPSRPKADNDTGENRQEAPNISSSECFVDESSQDTVMSVEPADKESDFTAENVSHDEEINMRKDAGSGSNELSYKETDTAIDKVKRSLEFQGTDNSHKGKFNIFSKCPN